MPPVAPAPPPGLFRWTWSLFAAFLAIVCFSPDAQGQTVFPYTEDFDDGLSCSLPDKWSLAPNATSGETWEFVRSTQHGAEQDHTSGSGCFATVNDASPHATPTSLISPVFNFSLITNPVLSFWVQNQAQGRPPTFYSELYIDVSTDGGNIYTNGVGTAISRYRRWTQVEVDLSAFAGQPSVRIRFRAVEAPASTNTSLSDLSLDDVFIGGDVADGAVFAISPGSDGTYSFGEVTQCSRLERLFTITNEGLNPSRLNVSSVSLFGNATFSIVEIEPSLPVSLKENESVGVLVAFEPTTPGAQAATLTISYNLDSGVQQTFNVAITGTGGPDGANSGEGEGYVWRNSTACSTPAIGLEDVGLGNEAGDTQIAAWQGTADDGFFALDLTPTIGSFRFYGEEYSTAYINSNGYIFFEFGSAESDPSYPATTDAENAYIAALGDDLNPGAGGFVSYGGRDTDGDTAIDALVVTYFRVPRAEVTEEFATFQVILRPGDVPGANGTVKIQYLTGSSPDDGQPLSQGFGTPGSFNADARVGITGDQGFASVLYREDGVGGVLLEATSLALEFLPRLERIFGTDAPSDVAGWRMLSAPTAGMTVAHLAEQNLVQGLPDEYPVDANGNIALPNLYTDYSATEGYQIPAGLADVLTPGKGMLWYLYDIEYDPEVDANIFTGQSESYPLPAPVVAAGAPQDGDVTTPLANANAAAGVKWELLGNPFADTLDISDIGSWTTGALASSVGQFWDPATQTYVPTSTLGDELPVWQGALFENDTATEITYPISASAGFGVPTPSGARPEEAENRVVRFELSGTAAGSGQPTLDQALVLEFSEAGTDGWDLRDAAKLVPLTGSYAVAAFEGERNGETLMKAQESRALTPDPFEVPIQIEATDVTGDLELRWAFENAPEDWIFALVDLETDERIDLYAQASYAFQVVGGRASAAPRTDQSARARNPEQLPVSLELAQRADARFALSVTPKDRLTALDEEAALPTVADLGSPYPNPFPAATTVRFAVPEAVHVTLVAHDMLGRRVAVLVDEPVAAGYHTARWRPQDLPSGVYLLRMDAGDQRRVQKVTFVN